MLLREIKKLNGNIRIEDVAKMSGLSAVRLYEINKYPELKNLKLATMEAIFRATYKLCGKGLTPDKYLIGVILPFSNK